MLTTYYLIPHSNYLILNCSEYTSSGVVSRDIEISKLVHELKIEIFTSLALTELHRFKEENLRCDADAM